ncbi:hypothetical protein Brsp03_00601 [Brucella sp. NBRC 12951]|jgi:hypothetical protein
MCQFGWLDLILFKKLLILRDQIMRKAETVQPGGLAGSPFAPPAEEFLQNYETCTDCNEGVGEVENCE